KFPLIRCDFHFDPLGWVSESNGGHEHTPANYVIGQIDFTSNTANALADNAKNLNKPSGLKVIDNKLFVADRNNNRVVIFDLPIQQNSPSATFAIGQTTVSSINPGGNAANQLLGPVNIASDGSTLAIVEITGNRVKVFNTIPSSSGPTADFVIGANDFGDAPEAPFTPYTTFSGFQKSAAIFDGRLHVVDNGYNRIKVWNLASISSGAPPNQCIGQSDWNTSSNILGKDNGTKFKNLKFPSVLKRDDKYTWIADTYNSRLIRIKNEAFAEYLETPFVSIN
ncbi:MAG: hypothetical protein ACLGGX_06045, partial [Bdellovibrionia bacterium]